MPDVHPMTSMMVSNEISVLRRLHGMLEQDQVKTRDQFLDLMTAAFQHGKLELRALSDDLGFSFSAVYRWSEGQNAPHPSVWPNIVAWVMKAIETKVDAYEVVRPRNPDRDGELM